MKHPWSWMVWIGTCVAALSSTRNPLYLILILMCIAVVSLVVRSARDAPSLPISRVHFALMVTAISTLFNMATSHFGEHVLFRLPEGIPLLGGNVTLEALVFGALNGLVLSGMFAAFAALNQAVPIRGLVQLIPKAFYPLAVVLSIAVTYVPTTLRQLEGIRQAQRVRGHRMRGLRDWLPLFIPLLVGGLERAVGLAEAMTARGFAHGRSASTDQTRLALGGGALTLSTGWLLRFVWDQALLGLAFLTLGAGMVFASIWLIGKRTPRTTYRQQSWKWQDGLTILTAALALGFYLLPLPGLDRASLGYSPYPSLEPPGFNLSIGLATLGLLGPAVDNLIAIRIQQEVKEFRHDHL